MQVLATDRTEELSRDELMRLGLLDGWRGFLMACLASQYVRLKWAKLLILQSDVAVKEPPP